MCVKKVNSEIVFLFAFCLFILKKYNVNVTTLNKVQHL